jgi:hypothetical protein
MPMQGAVLRGREGGNSASKRTESVFRSPPLHTASVGKHVRQPFFFTLYTTDCIFKCLQHADGICKPSGTKVRGDWAKFW